METTNQLQLYSISAAAKLLHLGKDAVYGLIAKGKIGFIEIGKRKKIPYQELVRFQSEVIVRGTVAKTNLQQLRSVSQSILSPSKNSSIEFDGKSFINKKLMETKWQLSESATG